MCYEDTPKTSNDDFVFQPCDILIPLTWKLLEEVAEKGLCKSIGVGNFNTTQIDTVRKCAKVSMFGLETIQLNLIGSACHERKLCSDENVQLP